MPKSQLRGSIYLNHKLRGMGAKLGITQQHVRLTPLQKRMMVWTFVYRRVTDVPDVVEWVLVLAVHFLRTFLYSFELYHRMKDRFRILLASFIMVAASLVYIVLHWQQRTWVRLLSLLFF